MKKKRKLGLVPRCLLGLMTVIVLVAGADAGRQVYRFHNVRIETEDGGVREYMLESVEIVTREVDGGLQRWWRTFLFIEKTSGTSASASADADVVKIEHRFNPIGRQEWFTAFVTEPSVKKQWEGMEFLMTLPRDVFRLDLLTLGGFGALLVGLAEAWVLAALCAAGAKASNLSSCGAVMRDASNRETRCLWFGN